MPKKVIAKKTARAGQPSKAPKSTPAAKPVTKPAPRKVSKPVASKPVAAKAAKAAKPAPAPAKPAAKRNIHAAEYEAFKDRLFKLRERINGQLNSLADDSLKYVDDSSSEDRTDDFDREFALNLMSNGHDSLYEINDALRRIEQGSYGTCEECGKSIEKPRLQALPFTKMCVGCKQAAERGRTRYRPLGDTLAQAAEPPAETAEAEETE